MPDLLRVTSTPRLDRPLLLAGFLGWANAGSASSGAIEHLLGDPRPESCADLDADLCFDQTVIRPIAHRGGGKAWRLTFPTIRCYAVRRPERAHDLLLILGPEPSLRWQTIARELAEFASAVGVESAIMLGAYIGAVSHRTLALSSRCLSTELASRFAARSIVDTEYEGPTAFQTALMQALGAVGIEAASLWIASPPYVQGPNPRASLALLDAADRALEANLDLDRLRQASTDWTRRLDALLRSNPTLLNQLRSMVPNEPADDDEPGQGGAEGARPDQPTPELPSSDVIIAELERFLRGQQKPPEEKG
jgi:proteasome assembly chaperone (PAC2) family protein